MTAEAGREERLFGGYTGRMLFLTAGGTMLTYLARLVLSPLLPRIIADLSITSGQAGVALTVMWAMIALWQFPGGRYSDRLSRKTVLVAGLVVLGTGTAMLTGVRSYPTFLLAVTVLGVGAGLYPPVAFAFVSDLFVRRRGQAFGITAASIDLGGILAAATAAVVLGVAAWRVAFLPIVALTGLALVATHRWQREPYAVAAVDLDTRETARRLFGVRKIRWVLVVFSLFAFVWQGVMSFLPASLVARGIDPALANNAFAALFVVGIVSRPLAGGLGDRLTHVVVALGSCAAAGLGLSVVVAGQTLPVLAGGVVLLGVGLAAFWPVMNAYVMALFPTDHLGGDFGAIRTVSMGVGSLGPAYVGVVAETAGYAAAFGGFVACLLACVALLLWVR